MRKFQEQNETFQANRARMAEGLALALARKDQVFYVWHCPDWGESLTWRRAFKTHAINLVGNMYNLGEKDCAL